MSITKMPPQIYYVIADRSGEGYRNSYAIAARMDDLDEAKAWAMKQFDQNEIAARVGLKYDNTITRGWVIREDDFNAGRYENRFPIEYPDWWTDEFEKWFES